MGNRKARVERPCGVDPATALDGGARSNVVVDGNGDVGSENTNGHAGVGRFGFLVGEIAVPDDFDSMGAQEIAADFGLDDRHRPSLDRPTADPSGLTVRPSRRPR
jgi:hypothetical protein